MQVSRQRSGRNINPLGPLRVNLTLALKTLVANRAALTNQMVLEVWPTPTPLTSPPTPCWPPDLTFLALNIRIKLGKEFFYIPRVNTD